MSESSKEDVFNFLLANQDFREWVANPTEERTQYWEKWIANNKENAEVVERAKSTLQNLHFKEEFLPQDRLENILTKIISEEPSAQVHAQQTGSNKGWWLAAAAVGLFLAAGAIFVFFNSDQAGQHISYRTVSNPKGQKSRLKLPDGTIVNLNAGSTLEFPESFSGEVRSVGLSGEAYFEVVEQKDHPFVVNTDSLKVTVLGTSFNFRNYGWNHTVDIALTEGSLLVQTRSSDDEIMLSPGEKAILDKASMKLSRSAFEEDTEIAWRKNLLVFENASFPHFIAKLENWYGVDIQIEGTPSADWSVNGRFQNESLEEVLLGLQFTYQMDYHIIGKKVRLVIK